MSITRLLVIVVLVMAGMLILQLVGVFGAYSCAPATPAPSWSSQTSRSPAWTKIAFASDRDGNWEIYVMNADGTSQTNLTNNPTGDRYPAWSPR
jgi:hypothetical protein